MCLAEWLADSLIGWLAQYLTHIAPHILLLNSKMLYIEVCVCVIVCNR